MIRPSLNLACTVAAMRASNQPGRKASHGESRPIATLDPGPQESKDSDAESPFVWIKRADLERILMLVEKLEDRIG